MVKPLISFISFNRSSAVASNLKALLDITKDDFELSIVDNGSTDGIWEYIKSINDDRIKFKKHFDKNYGGIYAVNYSLSKREKYQPFIHLDNDTLITDPDWIKKYQNAALTFNDLGLIGAVTKDYFNNYLTSFSQTTLNNSTCIYTNFVIGSCLYMTPEILELLGYFNEESCGADLEISRRINQFTQYKTGITMDFFNDYRSEVSCSECISKATCPFDKSIDSECCTVNYRKVYPNASFIPLAIKQTEEYINNISLGNTPLYSASIHDEESRKNHPYNYISSQKNFNFFSTFSNLNT